MFSRNLIALLVTATLLLGCGRKEPPKPPPSKIPAPINNLTVQQRGQEILLRMSFPTITIGGLPIENVETIEIWEMKRIIPTFLDLESDVDETEDAPEGDTATEEVAVEEAEPIPEEEEDATEEEAAGLFRLPEDALEEELEESKEAMIQADPREFAGAATLRWTLRGTELDSAVFGDQILVRIPVEEIPEGESAEETVLVLASRSLAGGRLVSPFSNLVKLLPREPPTAPSSLAVEAQPRGIEVSWEGGDGRKGYRIYRRLANVRDYGLPLFSASVDAERYLDASALFDQRYIYTVTSVSSTEPVVESAIAAEQEVHYQDRFPPTSPRDPVVLPESGRIRLLWEPSPEEDVKGYEIYRQGPEGEYERITPELVLGSEYLDRNLPGGLTYRYFIVAVDATGNQSEASEVIEARVP